MLLLLVDVGMASIDTIVLLLLLDYYWGDVEVKSTTTLSWFRSSTWSVVSVY